MNFEIVLEVAKKELRLFFALPIGYLFITTYLGVTLFVFFWGEAFFARNIADVRPMFEWIPVLFIFLCSALTMRSWSDERRTGTIEFIVTLPARSSDLVLGKFLGCFVLLLIALALTLPLPISVSVIANLDWGPVLAGYAAATLLGAAYLSIGLFVSARSENQIVALIVSVFLCAVFYAFGSSFVTGFFGNEFSEFLRQLGSGSRFESITRGVIDLADLYFYVSVTATFLTLNVFALHTLGWASDAQSGRHRQLANTYALIAVNVLAANVWLSFMPQMRWDVTEGDQYSIAEVTEQQLAQLQEPLLVRGYFSAKTHPLLAPLQPQLRDLLDEYAEVGGSRVRIEFIDPADDPEMEDEANTKYGIRPVPFRVADRHQASLVNSYFDILIQYGDEYEVLSFRDLIEVKATSESEIDVQLRNPEYDITRAIKKVLAGFQSEGSIFDYISQAISFAGYISSADKLPQGLEELRAPLTEALEELQGQASGKFTWQVVDPDADGGTVAEEIRTNYGFQPMAASLFDANRFYFYLTLTDGETVISLPVPDSSDKDAITRIIEEGMKRFATGLLSGVALHTPVVPPPQYMGQPPMGAQFNDLRAYLSSEYDVSSATLRMQVPTMTDVLLVVDPNNLTDAQVFEIDQFLMRGATVVVAAGGQRTLIEQERLLATPNQTGLEEWLEHHGVTIDSSMVLDAQNSAFPIPVERDVGGFTFSQMMMVDYPFFVDIRSQGLVDENPVTGDLDQVTFAWGSPVSVDDEKNVDRSVHELFRSSDSSWKEIAPDVMPKVTEEGLSPYMAAPDAGSELLAIAIEGSFSSFFEESPALLDAIEAAKAEEEAEKVELDDETISELEEAEAESGIAMDPEANEEETDTVGVVGTVIEKSPESARLVVVGSSEFVSDSTIQLISSAGGALYTNSMQFLANVVDWANQDASLLSIRSRGHFNRTLPPLSDMGQQILEYGNYVGALLGLVVVFGVNYLLRARTRSRRNEWFGGSR